MTETCNLYQGLFLISVSRDPKKRKVKPVQKHLIQLDFGGLEDSDEDSDFDVQQCKGISNCLG